MEQFITGILLFKKNKSKIEVFIASISLINVLLHSFSSGSRTIIVYLGIAILSVYLIDKKGKINKFKTKFSMTSMLLLLITLIIYISIFRSESNTGFKDLLQTIVVYFTGSYIYLEKMTPIFHFNDTLLFGSAFFGGIVDILNLLLSVIGINFTQISSIISEFNQISLPIGNDIRYNAFPTMIYTFMYDFGKLGIIIGPFLFGLLSRYFYTKMEKYRTVRYKGMYIVVIVMIYESIFRWMGVYFNVWICIFIFWVLSRNSEINT